MTLYIAKVIFLHFHTLSKRVYLWYNFNINSNGKKLFYGIFFSIFIIVGSGMLIFWFVKLAQFKSSKEINTTVISIECNYDKREMDVLFEFQSNGEYITANAHYNNLGYNDGRLIYYECLQTKKHINSKNQIVVYGKTEIIVIFGGCLFFLFGIFCGLFTSAFGVYC